MSQAFFAQSLGLFWVDTRGVIFHPDRSTENNFWNCKKVDDTVLVKKSIVSLLAKDLDKYMEDKIARKICYYLIGERDRRHFLPDVIKLLAVGDQTETSKKPRETKEKIFHYVTVMGITIT